MDSGFLNCMMMQVGLGVRHVTMMSSATHFCTNLRLGAILRLRSARREVGHKARGRPGPYHLRDCRTLLSIDAQTRETVNSGAKKRISQRTYSTQCSKMV
eukprot:2740141-Pleurochrysis_carterae.AAC.3